MVAGAPVVVVGTLAVGGLWWWPVVIKLLYFKKKKREKKWRKGIVRKEKAMSLFWNKNIRYHFIDI